MTELDPVLKEAAQHIANRYYSLDWAEMIGRLIVEIENTATSSDYQFAPVTPEELTEFLSYLSVDITARLQEGKWPLP